MVINVLLDYKPLIVSYYTKRTTTIGALVFYTNKQQAYRVIATGYACLSIKEILEKMYNTANI